MLKKTTKNIITILLVLILISLIVIILLSILSLFKEDLNEFNLPESKSFQREKPPKVTLPDVVYNLTGTVKKFEKNSIIFEATIPKLNEKNEIVMETELRKALVTPLTKFTRLSFIKQEGTNRETPQEKSITFQDIKINDYIEVISNQNILQKQEFEVTQIRILPH